MAPPENGPPVTIYDPALIPTMDRPRIDDLDREILKQLSEDGRVPYETVGQRVGLTAEEVRERVEEMQEQGIISKFTVLTDPMAMGYIPVAYGLTTKPGHTDEVAEELSSHRHVYKLWILSGRHNIVAHACFRDIAEFQEFTHETINNIQGITAYESSIATRSVSDEGGIVL